MKKLLIIMFGMVLPLIGMDDNVRKIFRDPQNGEFIIYYIPKELACKPVNFAFYLDKQKEEAREETENTPERSAVGYIPIAFVRTGRLATRLSRMTDIKETNPIEINVDNNQTYEELFGNQQKAEKQKIEEKRITKNKNKNENKRIKQEMQRRK
jgi:hypothetical protein